MTSRVQKILDLVERGGNNTGIGGLGGGVSDNTTLQLFNALNELKNQLQVKKNKFAADYFLLQISERPNTRHSGLKVSGSQTTRFKLGILLREE